MTEYCKYGKSIQKADGGMRSVLFSIIVVAYLVTTYGMAVHYRTPMLVRLCGTVSALCQGQNGQGAAQTHWLPKRHLPMTKQPAVFFREASFIGHPSRDIDSPRRNVHDSDVALHTVPERTLGPDRAPPSA
ncbi:MAG TPA: hypothetical protein VES59_01015 [Bacteroidota bacterium]|nr:hypothetical protein [Bacteroidota bacterium]